MAAVGAAADLAICKIRAVTVCRHLLYCSFLMCILLFLREYVVKLTGWTGSRCRDPKGHRRALLRQVECHDRRRPKAMVEANRLSCASCRTTDERWQSFLYRPGRASRAGVTQTKD